MEQCNFVDFIMSMKTIILLRIKMKKKTINSLSLCMYRMLQVNFLL